MPAVGFSNGSISVMHGEEHIEIISTSIRPVLCFDLEYLCRVVFSLFSFNWQIIYDINYLKLISKV